MKKRSLWLSAAAALVLAARAGRLWFDDLFCRPAASAQRIAPTRVLIAIQNPSALTKGALRVCRCLLRHALQVTTTPSDLFDLRLFGRTSDQHSEHAGGADGRGLWLRRRQLHHRSTMPKESSSGAVKGLNGPLRASSSPAIRPTSLPHSRQSHVLTVVNQATGGSFRWAFPASIASA